MFYKLFHYFIFIYKLVLGGNVYENNCKIKREFEKRQKATDFMDLKIQQKLHHINFGC